jgi:hypothetical protein
VCIYALDINVLFATTSLGQNSPRIVPASITGDKIQVSRTLLEEMFHFYRW